MLKVDAMSLSNDSVTVTSLLLDDDVIDTDITRLEGQLEVTRFIVVFIIMPVVTCFGVVGNVMNISVLTRRWMRSSTNYYLTALAICDINYLVFAFTLILPFYMPSIFVKKEYLSFYVYVGKPLANLFSNTGVWLTLTFTVERYIGVCHVMRGKVWCTPQRAKYIILVVAAVSSLLTLPNFFESTVFETEPGIYRQGPRDFAKGSTYSLGYYWINATLFTFLPLLFLSIFNILLVKSVAVATKKRREMTNERQERHMREQRKITIMLIAVVIVFLICQLPQAVSFLYLQFLEGQGGMDKKTELRFRIAGNLFNLLVMINSSINFVLYSSFSLKFRRTFKILFYRCSDKRVQPPFIFSEVFSQGGDPRGARSHAPSSPYTSTPIRPATSYLSINGTTAFTSPSPSCSNLQKAAAGHNKNGYLSMKPDSKFNNNIISCV